MAIFALALMVFVLLGNALATYPGYHYPAYVKNAFLQFGVLALLLCWVWQSVRQKPAPESPRPQWWRQHRIEILFGAFVLWAFGSVFWSGLLYIAFLGFVPILYRAGWMLLAAHFLTSRRQLLAMLIAILTAGFLAALVPIIAALQAVEPWSAAGFFAALAAKIERVHGHRNFFAMFLLSPICLALVFLLQLLGHWRRGIVQV